MGITQTMFTQRIRAVSGLALIAILAAACTSGSGATASPSSPAASVAPSTAASPSAAASPSTAASPSASASSAAEVYELKVVTGTGTLGQYLTGEDGKTLYTFKNDTANSGKSACNGQCADFWPAFTVDSMDEVKAGTGVTGAITLVTRDDGKKQVAYKGLPLYYFKNDTKAGDTNGQGVQNIWFVAAP